jgi:hypothetical protein
MDSLISWRRVLQKLIVTQIVNKLRGFYRTRSYRAATGPTGILLFKIHINVILQLMLMVSSGSYRNSEVISRGETDRNQVLHLPISLDKYPDIVYQTN